MYSFQTQLKTGVLAGAKKGWNSFIWMGKIVIPVSLLVTLLQWAGWLNQLDFLLNPLTNLINLPPEAALPIITGMLINNYAVIASVTVIPFTIEQITLIAIFNLIAHNLIMEGIVQHRSGINVFKTTLARIAAAILAVLIVSRVLGDTGQSVAVQAVIAAHTPFLEAMKVWGVDTMGLLLKILGIIMVTMILLESLKALGWIEKSLRLFKPLMKILGLSDRTAMMWVTGIIFGLLYGGAVIVEESKTGTLAREEVERLHFSVGTAHALVEETALFAILGVNIFWLLVPRLTMAIIVVQSYRALRYLKNRLIHQ
ncbi:nucleoside recognition domain-containing protein [Chloroflexota bacterium]